MRHFLKLKAISLLFPCTFIFKKSIFIGGVHVRLLHILEDVTPDLLVHDATDLDPQGLEDLLRPEICVDQIHLEICVDRIHREIAVYLHEDVTGPQL